MKRNSTDHYIRVIAETRSISIAAERLGISQPALSSYLKKKEQELGVILFDRSVLPLVITEAGKAYLEYLDGVAGLFAKFRKLVDEKPEWRRA